MPRLRPMLHFQIRRAMTTERWSLIIRQNLDDDSEEAMIGEHGSGMIHLAQRPKRGAMMTDMQYRFGGTLEGVLAKRIGIEKHGDSIAIFASLKGEPMHQLGPPVHLHFDGPFYIGLGFCSHLPITPDSCCFLKRCPRDLGW